MIVDLPSGKPTGWTPTVPSPSPDRRNRSMAHARGKSSCICIPKNFHNWGILDKILFVVCVTVLLVDLCFEVAKRLGFFGEGGSAGGTKAEASAAAVAAAAETSALEDPLVWLVVMGIGSVAVVAFFVAKLRGGRGGASSPNRARTFTFQNRDSRFRYPNIRNWSGIDKLLLVLAVTAIVGDLTIEVFSLGKSDGDSAEAGASSLRGTAETAEAPKEVQAEPKEDPKAVAATIESAAKNKYAKPAECTSEQINKVQTSGINGDGCKGKPYTQACSFTKATKIHKATWLSSFAEEINAERASDETSFVTALVGRDCDKLEDELYFPKADGASEAVKSIGKKPKLFCTKPSWSESEEFAAKWGLVKSSAQIGDEGDFGSKTLDKYMTENNEGKTIKDAVIINTDGDSIKAVNGGKGTLARTRYVEFGYDWQDGWTGYELQPLITELDELGHSCYWPGDGKLWRITNCWQPFYSFKSYSTVACVNRNLAPKLADSMEKMFLTTIG